MRRRERRDPQGHNANNFEAPTPLPPVLCPDENPHSLHSVYPPPVELAYPRYYPPPLATHTYLPPPIPSMMMYKDAPLPPEYLAYYQSMTLPPTGGGYMYPPPVQPLTLPRPEKRKRGFSTAPTSSFSSVRKTKRQKVDTEDNEAAAMITNLSRAGAGYAVTTGTLPSKNFTSTLPGVAPTWSTPSPAVADPEEEEEEEETDIPIKQEAKQPVGHSVTHSPEYPLLPQPRKSVGARQASPQSPHSSPHSPVSPPKEERLPSPVATSSPQSVSTSQPLTAHRHSYRHRGTVPNALSASSEELQSNSTEPTSVPVGTSAQPPRRKLTLRELQQWFTYPQNIAAERLGKYACDLSKQFKVYATGVCGIPGKRMRWPYGSLLRIDKCREEIKKEWESGQICKCAYDAWMIALSKEETCRKLSCSCMEERLSVITSTLSSGADDDTEESL